MIHSTHMRNPVPVASERLELLESSDAVLVDGASDWMGMRVRDRSGREIGRVDGLLAQPRDRRVRFVRITSGGFLGLGAEHSYVPSEAVAAVDPNTICLDKLLDDVRQAPSYAPDLVDERGWMEASYRHFGYGAPD